MTLFRTELENYLVEKGFSKDNITIVDGANDQATQTGQIDNFITEGVDVLIINPVNSSSAATITDKVVAAGSRLYTSTVSRMKKSRRDGQITTGMLHTLDVMPVSPVLSRVK